MLLGSTSSTTPRGTRRHTPAGGPPVTAVSALPVTAAALSLQPEVDPVACELPFGLAAAPATVDPIAALPGLSSRPCSGRREPCAAGMDFPDGCDGKAVPAYNLR